MYSLYLNTDPMLSFPSTSPRARVFNDVETFIRDKDFVIASMDDARPWGGFFVIDESESQRFIETFFSHLTLDDFSGFAHLSPKILLVEPSKRLSWQYHHRRAEIWKVIGGNAGIIISDTDEQTPLKNLALNDIVELRQGERHRLVGLEEWGIVAEIWKHTDRNNPSNEDDIVRVEDDFGR